MDNILEESSHQLLEYSNVCICVVIANHTNFLIYTVVGELLFAMSGFTIGRHLLIGLFLMDLRMDYLLTELITIKGIPLIIAGLFPKKDRQEIQGFQ